ncbi:hypothetical protein ACFX15_001267 [Malus domestica]
MKTMKIREKRFTCEFLNTVNRTDDERSSKKVYFFGSEFSEGKDFRNPDFYEPRVFGSDTPSDDVLLVGRWAGFL